MSKIIARLLPLLLFCHLFPAGAGAQQPAPGLKLGDAVVTGFAGVIAPDPGKPRPAKKSAIDLTFINPDGPSARVVSIGRPGHGWDGRLFQAPKSFDVFARDTGQVFGVALDDQPAPSIYLAATSAFGLNLVGRGADGLPERRKVGGPGTGWMKGQFGLELQGDPGSIYKVDGTTGVVTLFAKVMLDGVPNPGPALGNLAYDAAHKQLFVSDLYTGMIHRIAIADGSEPGAPYDHGVTGRAAASLPPLRFTPANRPNIANQKFNAENPDSWGFAPPERRVWGLAVQASRLFYAVRNGAAAEAPQIWSVGIARDGSFAPDARLEVEVAAQPGPYPVSDIAFSQTGAMILAQRAPISASYDYSAFTRPAEPRLLRYWLKDATDPPSPGLWKPMPEEYPVGFAGTYRNTNGGVALGYGYRQDGTLDGASCEASLWTTGQNLRNNPALRSQLEPGGPLLVNGLQGNPPDMVRRADEPPSISYFVDYDDRFDDARASGHIGSVRILVAPCAGAVAGVSSSPPYVSGPQTPTTTPPNPPCVGPNCNPPPETPVNIAIKKTAGAVKYDEQTGLWTIEFKLDVSNAGNPFAPGSSISISDPVPAGLTLVSAVGTGWTCIPVLPISSGNLNCGYNFGSGVFNTAAHLNPLVLTFTTRTPGKYENCASVGVAPGSGLHETTLADNKDCATVELKQSKFDISLAKSFEKGATDGTGAFTLKVKNEGDGLVIPATTIKITDTVPVGVTLTGFGGSSAANWSCTPNFNVVGLATLICTYVGPPGAFATGAFLPDLVLNSALASAGAEIGIYQNCATVNPTNGSTPVVETNTTNNTACAVTTTINTSGCETGGCPPPEAVCKQDVLFIVDASVSITNLGAVKSGIRNFLQPMQGHGGSANIFSFNNGGIGTSNPSWIDISGGWQLVNANWSTLPNPIALGGTRTDWDDALHHGVPVAAAAPLTGKPLVIFITDGEPTAYINDTSTLEIDANTMPVTASQQAVPWINAIRAAGSPLIAVGFGAVSSSGYLDAAFTGNSSGPGNVNLETSSVIKMASVNSLPGVLGALGNQMCGTLSLNKTISPSVFFHQLPAGTGSSVAVNDTIPFTLTLTNNATTPVTGVVVQDQVPAVVSGVTIGAASLGTGTATGNLVKWMLTPALPARSSATLAFTGKFVKTYTAVADETYTNYAQVTAATNYTATQLNNMNPVSGPVTEPDESMATFREIIQGPPPPNPCLQPNAPTHCFLSVNKVRTNPGAEDGSCSSSAPGGPANPCPFTISVGLNNIPPGSTVTVSDNLTLAGSSVSWPGTVAPSICTPAPTLVSFSCIHTGLSSFSGGVTVMIPPGQSGLLQNCITVTVTNTTTTPPFNKTATACATVTLTQPPGICPPGTTQQLRAGHGECLPPPPICQPPMIPGPVAGQCICPPPTVLRGKRCVPPLQCRSPLVPNAAGTVCVCKPGLVQKGRTCVEQPTCKPPAKLNRRGACECPRDMVAKGSSCIERERARPQISPGDFIRTTPGGGRDNPRGGRDTDSPRGGGQGPTDFPGKR